MQFSSEGKTNPKSRSIHYFLRKLIRCTLEDSVFLSKAVWTRWNLVFYFWTRPDPDAVTMSCSNFVSPCSWHTCLQPEYYFKTFYAKSGFGSQTRHRRTVARFKYNLKSNYHYRILTISLTCCSDEREYDSNDDWWGWKEWIITNVPLSSSSSAGCCHAPLVALTGSLHP